MQFTRIIKKDRRSSLPCPHTCPGPDPPVQEAPAGAASLFLILLYSHSCSPASQPAPQQTAPCLSSQPHNRRLRSGAVQPQAGQIYLYGEQHAVEKILNREVEIWNDHYHNHNMRHLFVELPYYTAEYLNLWMKSDSDEILNALYDDWEGSAAHNPYIKPFYQAIKEKCPETVFHGTNVGHQYFSTESAIWNI